MLQIATSLGQLRFGQLMEVYMQGNLETCGEQGLLQAEQEFYQYLQTCFFKTEGAVYAIWTEDDKYVSALRLEPYKDGLLLAALETAPKYRRRGCGEKLIKAVISRFAGQKIYSHVSKENLPSLAIHEKCGFLQILDYAVYIDGSVSSNAVTFCHQ